MKTLNTYIEERLNITNNVISERLVLSKDKHTLFPKTKDELKELIKSEMENNGNECSLNHIDVTKITDMSNLFYKSDFNGDISKWNVSIVENMADMFNQSKFNGDISDWDVSNVTDMSGMFYDSAFDGDISKWDVSNVTDMNGMFQQTKFTGKNGDISNWDVLNVKNINWMFFKSKFNCNIDDWNISNTTDMVSAFWKCPLENNPPKWYNNQ